MKRNKVAAVSLLFCSLAMIAGMILKIDIYWSVTDVLVTIICAVNGVLLLKSKSTNE